MSRSRSCLAVILYFGFSFHAVPAQDSWLRPVVVTGVVSQETVEEGPPCPVADVEVALRMFAGDLLREDRRREAFGPPVAAARTNAKGEYALTLPLWSTMVDAQLALLVVHGGVVAADGVLPFNRTTHRRNLIVRQPKKNACELRFVDGRGRPLVRRTVVPLVPIERPSNVPVVGSGRIVYPSFERLVAAPPKTTDDQGRCRFDADVGLIAVDDAMIPFYVSGEKNETSEVVAIAPGAASRPSEDFLSKALKGKAIDSEWLRPPSESALALQLSARRAQRGVAAGRVVDEHGTPILGAEVVVESHDAPPTPEASPLIDGFRPRKPFARTDADGRFRIEHLPPGRFRLRAAARGRAPSYGPAFELVPASAAPALGSDAPVADSDGPAVGSGAPAAGFEVFAGTMVLRPGARLRVIGTWGYLQFRTGYLRLEEDGVVEGFGPGSLDVSTWPGGCGSWESETPVVVPTEGEVTVEFPVP